MGSLPDSARSLIESSALAHLVTLNEDGSPQVSVVWVGLEDDEVVCAHLPRNRKVRNIERDSRVALSIETNEVNDMGLQHYLVVYGTARITEGGAPERSTSSPRRTWARVRISPRCPIRPRVT